MFVVYNFFFFTSGRPPHVPRLLHGACPTKRHDELLIHVNTAFVQGGKTLLERGDIITLVRAEGIAFGSVCPHRTSATARRIETIFSIEATTHVECYNDNYDVIGHMVWQPCLGKNGKTLDLCISETAPSKKIRNLAHVKYSPWEM